MPLRPVGGFFRPRTRSKRTFDQGGMLIEEIGDASAGRGRGGCPVLQFEIGEAELRDEDSAHECLLRA